MAIGEIASWLGRNVLATTKVDIYSDSQAAIRSLGSMSLNMITARNFRAFLNEMTKLFENRLEWFAGQKIIRENCRSEDFERLGTTLQIPREFESIGIARTTCKPNSRW